jgi:hypothetical protein
VSQCGALTPCGGDVTGGWSIQDGCALEAAVAMTDLVTGCEDTYTGTLDVRLEGTFTFGADQTYVSEATVLGTAHLLLTPSACFMETCAELTQELDNPVATVPASPIAGGSCTPAGTQCRCTIAFIPMVTAEQGTYAVSADTLTMSPTDATPPWSTDFCVADGKLRMSPRIAYDNVLDPTAQFQGSVALVRAR